MGPDPGGFRLWWRQLKGSDATLDNAHVAEDDLARTTTMYRIIAVGRTCSLTPSNAIKSCWWWNWEASTLSALSGRKTMRSDTEPTEQGLAGVMVVLLQCS